MNRVHRMMIVATLALGALTVSVLISVHDRFTERLQEISVRLLTAGDGGGTHG